MSASPGRSPSDLDPSAPSTTSNPHSPIPETSPPLGISPAQLVGSALGAVSAAVATSFFGVTGTVIGAAVVSVVATVGTAAYTQSLRRGAEAVRRGTVPAVPVLRSERLRRLPWARLGVAAAVVLVASLGTITLIEAVSGKPMAETVGASSSGDGTTLGELSSTTSSGTSDDDPEPEPDAEPSDDSDPSTPPSPAPSDAPDEQPSDQPSSEPSSEPSEEPSSEPSDEPSDPETSDPTEPTEPSSSKTTQTPRQDRVGPPNDPAVL